MTSRKKVVARSTSHNTTAAVRARLKRAQGQLNAVVRMVDDDEPCDKVVTQLAAVNKALGAAAFMLISASLEECLESRARNSKEVSAQLQKLFLTLN